MGAPSHDGGQAGAGHIGDETHGGGDLAVEGSGLGVICCGESRGDARLAGGNGDVPGFEPGNGSCGGLDFFGGPAGREGGDRHDGAIGRHGLPRDRMQNCGTVAAAGRGDRI